MRSIFLAALLLMGTSGLAQAEDAGVEEKGYSFKDSLGLGLSLGTSSGIDPAVPYVSSSLGIRPSLKLPGGFRLLSSLSVGRELTDEDSNPERNESKLSDLYFMVNKGSLLKLGEHLSLGGMLRWYLPVSEASQLAGLKSAGRVGARLSFSYDKIGLAFDAEFQKNFHGSTTATLEDCLTPRSGARPLPVFQTDPTEFLGSTFSGGAACGADNQLVSHSFIWALSGSYRLTKQLSLGLGYSIVDSVGYDNRVVTCDELGVLGCAPGQEVGHNPGFDTHHRYSQSFSVDLSYSLAKGTTLTAGIGNSLPQRKLNAKDFYNPFLLYWNSSNFTTVSVGLSKSL